jgi:hypothetical protein
MPNKISLEKDVHYKESEGYLKVPKGGIIRQPYIQAGENISVKRIGEEEFEFQIDELKPFIINPYTDLSNLSDITIESYEDIAPIASITISGDVSENINVYNNLTSNIRIKFEKSNLKIECK